MASVTNVTKLRKARVLPKRVKLPPAKVRAINRLSNDEIREIIRIHRKIGQIEVPGPIFVLKIF